MDGDTILDLAKGDCGPKNMRQFIESDVNLTELRQQMPCLERIKTSDVKLLPPICNPQKIIAIGLNYKSHCDEQKREIPKEPIFFSKFPTSIVGPTDNIFAHRITTKMDWEVELAVVIGSYAYQVSRQRAMSCIFGYTVAQDITAREWQKRNGGQWLISKSMDTFCPLGPCIIHKSNLDPTNLNIRCSVNGVMKQCGSTSDMIFPIDDIIHRISQSITLVPGDIILTGTCAGVGVFRNPREFLKVGDVIESEIEGIGKLINTVTEPES